MDDYLKTLLETKKISKTEYHIFLLFELTDLGKEFCHKFQEKLFMEEPAVMTNTGYAWVDGRKSMFREIKRTIDFVYQQIEAIKNDGSIY